MVHFVCELTVEQEQRYRTDAYTNMQGGLEGVVHRGDYMLGAEAVAKTIFVGGGMVEKSAENTVHHLSVLVAEHPRAVRFVAVATGGVVLFAAGQALEQVLNIENTVLAGPPETPTPHPADCQRIVGDLIKQAVRTPADEQRLQAAIECAVDNIKSAAATTATPTSTPFATTMENTPEKGVYFNPEGLVKALVVMSPAFLGVLAMYWLVKRNRKNYAENQKLQLEDALSFRSGRRVPFIVKGARGAILCAPAALPLIWGRIIPDSLAFPALVSAASIGFITGALYERTLPKENRYRDWAERQDE